MAYLYRHIRLDTDVPFYIGVGKNDDYNFHRANFFSNRSKEWKQVKNQTTIEVEIMMDGLDLNEAHKREVFFIDLYGRIDLGNGTLVNKSKGGNNAPESSWTKECIERRASQLRGRALPSWQKKLLSKAGKGKRVVWSYKPVIQYDKNGHKIKEYESVAAAGRALDIISSNISYVAKGKRLFAGGFIFKYKL